MAYQKTQSVLRQHQLAPNKKLGQNFLVHRHTAERILQLAAPAPSDIIIEVGVGLGALTIPLAARVTKVIGIEADSGLVRWHRSEQDLPANVELIHEDILKTDFAALAARTGGRLKILANLPYSISTPFLFKLINQHELIEQAVIMLQKEVAQRLVAVPGTKAYGVPSVLLASCGEACILMDVKPGEFHPRPKVDSAVIRLSFQPVPSRVVAVGDFDRSLLRKIVNAGFGQRRKTLLNALATPGLVADKTELAQILTACHIPPSIRAEKLDFEDFVTLTRALRPHLSDPAAPPENCHPEEV